jgi:hypothetical protein
MKDVVEIKFRGTTVELALKRVSGTTGQRKWLMVAVKRSPLSISRFNLILQNIYFKYGTIIRVGVQYSSFI